jgi:hypothetical protein
LLHIAAVHDRCDVIEWMVDSCGLKLTALDCEGTSVLETAKKAGAKAAELTILRYTARDSIGAYCVRFYRMRKALQLRRKRLRCVITIQAFFRSYAVRCVYLPLLRAVKGSYQRFMGLWGPVIDCLKNGSPRQIRWSELKANCDIYVSGAEPSEPHMAPPGTEEALIRQLIEASARTDVSEVDENELELKLHDDIALEKSAENTCIAVEDAEIGRKVRSTPGETVPAVEMIELSLSTTKWLEKADAKYRQLFCRRMEQLTGGYRSYALSKRLSHCRHPIYEAKLDEGQRILWTKLCRGDSERSHFSILVSLIR